MSGDPIRELPTNPSREVKPSELEIVHSLLNNKENYPIIKAAISPFRSAVIGAVLFGILSLAPVTIISDTLFKNPITSRLVLILVFMIIFFILTRTLK
jgi:hypothetical protein